MKHLFIKCLVSFLFLICANSYSQEYGKVLNKKDADVLFGLPERSVEMKTDVFKSILSKDKSHFMFKIIDNEINILDEKRNILFSKKTEKFDKNLLFKVFSKSKVEELLNLGMAETTYFEDRQNVFTITNGAYTLEFAQRCPPDCLYE